MGRCACRASWSRTAAGCRALSWFGLSMFAPVLQGWMVEGGHEMLQYSGGGCLQSETGGSAGYDKLGSAAARVERLSVTGN